MGVKALGVINRGVTSEIAPNHGDHLECDECGECIDICPVGALTSGAYRYQTRPWEMTHVGTICAHCADGCKTTLGTRNGRIVRGNNRDRSGINGEFLCVKGRYAFDFHDHPERLQSPLARRNGKLEEVSWSEALATAGGKFKAALKAGGAIGVVGSNHTTNEENYYLQKFARQALKTNHIDHHRTGDVVTLLDALAGGTGQLATVADLYECKAILVVGADLALEHPLLSFQIRANYRHHQARIYVATPRPVREDNYAAAVVRGADYASLGERLKAEPELAVLFDDSIKGDDVRKLVEFGESLGIPVKYVCLVDYANSRGALDMGVTPELLPGYQPSGQPGMRLDEMIAADLDVLWVVGANPLKNGAARKAGFLVVQDLFLTETAAAGRRGAAGRFGIREERHRDQRDRRGAEADARRRNHGREDRSGNHGIPGARDGRGRGARPVVARRGGGGDSQERAGIRGRAHSRGSAAGARCAPTTTGCSPRALSGGILRYCVR